MPRGVPKAGKRAPGAGRQRKFAGTERERARVPVGTADKIVDIFTMLYDLDITIADWEKRCEEKKTSPRYEQARKLVTEIRGAIDSLGIDFEAIFDTEK